VRWDIDWIEKRSQLTPNKTAIIDGDTKHHWSYKEINQRAHSLACYLSEEGVTKGDRVALISPNDISYFDFLFACMKLGAIFVPLNWRLSANEIQLIVEDSSPSLIAYHSKYKHLIDSNLPNIQVDSEYYYTIFDNDKRLCGIKLNEYDPLMIIYTGGTTGKSKGVVLTHSNIQWNALNTIVSWNLTAEDITLTYLPMFHTGGLNALTIPILVMGGTVLYARDFNPETSISLIENERCTILLMVPTMYHLIIQSSAFKKATFNRVKTFLSGGAPCPLTIYEAFAKKGVAFKEGYGLTEAGPNNFYIDPIDAKVKKGSIGKPMMFNKAKVVTEDGSVAEANEVGELLLYGHHIFNHYWRNKEATESTVVDGWLHTGDLAKVDQEGYYYIVGRMKEMIITGGENVYPLEVEQCIQNHPAVSEVAVIGLPHPKWGEAVVALISVLPGHTVSIEEIQQFCLVKLGKYKVPKQVKLMNELPKTPVGKIDKKLLRIKYQYIVK
jgi:fatty-acyl-CoA synthase